MIDAQEEIFASSFAAAAYLQSIDFHYIAVLMQTDGDKKIELKPGQSLAEIMNICLGPGGGSMVGAVLGSTKQEPLVVGKPSTFMMDYLAKK
uniref:Uncharacterized protein n=1 Tax=Aegilops tauschii subsp. strangulata TaxID=200361 RepID=A0A453CAD6_AEGTS